MTITTRRPAAAARRAALALALATGAASAQTAPSAIVPPPPPAPAVPAPTVPAPAVPAPATPAIVAPPPAPATPSPAAAPATPRQRREPVAMPVGDLQTLEKITGRVRSVEAKVGGPIVVGALEITVRACMKRPQEDIPETAAFVEINERRPGQDGATRVFTGWIFGNSPAVSALEHPVYDVWLVDCRATASTSSGPISR